MEEKTVKPVVGTPTQPQSPKLEASKSSVSKAALPETSKAEPETVDKLTDVKNEAKGPDVDTLIPSDPYYLDPLFYEVASYFGIEQGEYDGAKNYLSDIVEYVIRDQKSNEPAVVLKALRELEELIQQPSWDEKRYKNVYRYIRLASKKESIQEAMGAFEKHAKGEVT